MSLRLTGAPRIDVFILEDSLHLGLGGALEGSRLVHLVRWSKIAQRSLMSDVRDLHTHETSTPVLTCV